MGEYLSLVNVTLLVEKKINSPPKTLTLSPLPNYAIMKKTLLLLITAMLPFGISAQCVSNPVNLHTFTYNGNTYQVVKENKSWADAAACAVEKGGYLAEINSQAEQDSVYANVQQAGINTANTVAPDGGQASYLWLGGNDLGTEGAWTWDGDNDGTGTQFWQGTASGNPVGGLYNNWGNEPDNFQNQDGLGLAITDWPLGSFSQWNDVKADNELYFIVEFDGLLSSEEPQVVPTLNLFPNPAQSSLTLEIPRTFRDAKGCQIQLFNAQGQKVSTASTFHTQAAIAVDHLPNGIYQLVLTGKNSQKASAKVLVQH